MVEVEVNTLSEIIGNKTPHRRIPYLGERAWMAEGEECNVIYWDVDNGSQINITKQMIIMKFPPTQNFYAYCSLFKRHEFCSVVNDAFFALFTQFSEHCPHFHPLTHFFRLADNLRKHASSLV